MIGTPELIIIFAVILLLFGANKLPELAQAMGKAIAEFKKAKIETELESELEKEKEIEIEKKNININEKFKQIK